MKTIYQSTEVAYNAVSIQDAIVMLPLINELEDQFIKTAQRKESAEEENKTESFNYRETVEKYVSLGNQLQVLYKLGFRGSRPNYVQFDPAYFPVE